MFVCGAHSAAQAERQWKTARQSRNTIVAIELGAVRMIARVHLRKEGRSESLCKAKFAQALREEHADRF